MICVFAVRFIDQNSILYINKKNSQNLSDKSSLQLLGYLKGFDYNIILHQSNNSVNSHYIQLNKNKLSKVSQNGVDSEKFCYIKLSASEVEKIKNKNFLLKLSHILQALCLQKF